MNSSTISNTEINEDVTQEMNFSQNNFFYIIWAAASSLSHYPLGRKFLLDYALTEVIKIKNQIRHVTV